MSYVTDIYVYKKINKFHRDFYIIFIKKIHFFKVPFIFSYKTVMKFYHFKYFIKIM